MLSPSPNKAHYTTGLGIPTVVVDGNNITPVYAAGKEAVERARAGEGPTFIEALCQCWYDNSGWGGAKANVDGAFGTPYRTDDGELVLQHCIACHTIETRILPAKKSFADWSYWLIDRSSTGGRSGYLPEVVRTRSEDHCVVPGHILPSVGEDGVPGSLTAAGSMPPTWFVAGRFRKSRRGLSLRCPGWAEYP